MSRFPVRVAALVSLVLVTVAVASTASGAAAGGPDLRLQLDSSARVDLRPGDRLTHTLRIWNAGDADAADVVAVVALPAGLRPLSVRASGGGACQLTSLIDSEGGQVASAMCAVGLLPPDASVTATIRLAVGAEASCRRLRTAGAVSSPDEPGRAARTGNRAALDQDAACRCAISLRARPLDPSVRPGEGVRAAVEVRNAGDGPARLTVTARTRGQVRRLWLGEHATRSVTLVWSMTASARPRTLVSAEAQLPDGTRCAVRATVVVRTAILAPGSQERPGAEGSPGGTPFTGASAAPTIAMIVLGVLGGLSLTASRRLGRISRG